LRPPGDFIRARNPWVRLRLMLLGWYVRFTTTSEFSSIWPASRRAPDGEPDRGPARGKA
jgi:hypothetical protein